MSSFNPLTNDHHKCWERFKQLKKAQQLPSAILLIGPQHAHLVDFAKNLAIGILCVGEEVCKTCQSCKLVYHADHPDLLWIRPEEKSNIIKIEQIRVLQEIVSISPQVSNRRVVLINPAENLNPAAANALLKLLEEPPECTLFILVTEQLSTILPTIISRCQAWHFPYSHTLKSEYLEIGEQYSHESTRGKIFQDLSIVIEDLTQLINKKRSIVELANQWKKYELKDLIWLVDLIHAQIIYYHFFKPAAKKNWTPSLIKLSQDCSPFLLFQQMNNTYKIKQKLNQNITMNHQLLLENFLLGYHSCY